MRLLFSLCIILCFAGLTHAQQPYSPIGYQVTPEIVDAYHQLAMARWQLNYYRQIQLPQQREVINNAVKLAELQTAILNRRLTDYRPFLAVGQYSPVRTAAENDLVAREIAANQLRHLQEKQINVMRFSGEIDELYQYDVLRAALRIQLLTARRGL